MDKRKGRAWALFVLYLLLLLRITVFRTGWSTNALFRGTLVAVPFQTVFSSLFHGDTLYFCYLFFGNVLWFVPLGAFLQRRGLRFWQTCLLGMLLSLLIEAGQFVLSTGTSETEDVILNTVGSMLGYLVMRHVCGAQAPDRDAQRAISTLAEASLTLVTAESCTGGLLGKLLTDVPGASQVYLGGVISYAYALKESLLDVDPAVLADQGAVCETVARQMAIGARTRFNADFALSVTGNAGPGVDAKNPHPGEIYIACAGAAECRCMMLTLHGSRAENRSAACRAALRLLLCVYASETSTRQV